MMQLENRDRWPNKQVERMRNYNKQFSQIKSKELFNKRKLVFVYFL